MSKPRYDWYETDQEVVVSVLVKNLNKSDVKIEFADRKLIFDGATESGDRYTLDVQLTGDILVDQCSFRVGSVKAEIHLKKKTNYRWLRLEHDGSTDAAPVVPVALNSVSSTSESGDAIKRYQEKIRLMEQKIKEVEEEEAKNDGVSELFKQIYSQGNEEIRKAMNKSFVESNGTVLSTNWTEVKEKPVEMKPPDGVEFKKYDS